MSMMRGYYAYLAIAAGWVLLLAVQDNWMLRLVAFALISAGALSLRRASAWYLRASAAADIAMAFELLCGPAVIPPGLLRIVLEYAALLPLLLTGCMLLFAVMAQMRKAGRSTLPEWALLVLWSAGWVLTLLAAPGWLNELAFQLTLTAEHTLIPLGYMALLVETFRAQREYLRTEEET